MSTRYAVTGSTAKAIVSSIETGIRSGALLPGELLPAVRTLADQLEISPGTAAQAYKALRGRGLVETDGRRGTRVRAKPTVVPRSASRLPVPPGARDVSSGAPDPRLLPAYGPRLRQLAPDPVLYGRTGPTAEFAEVARERLRADGLEPPALTAVSGCLDGIERLVTARLEPGDAVGVEDPGWANLLDLLAGLGFRVLPIEVDDSGPTVAGLRGALEAGARAVVITGRAQNPRGGDLTASRARELRRVVARRPETLVIEDDHAAELSSARLVTLAGATGSWAFVRSLSKPYGPDLRCAVLAGDEETVARVEGRQWLGARWVSTILQQLAVRLWTDPSVESLVRKAGRRYDERRRAVLDALAARGIEAYGRAGMNVWVPVDDETGVCARLLEAGWVVAPGRMFRIASPQGIRVTTAQLDDDEPARLAEAVAGAIRPGDRGSTV